MNVIHDDRWVNKSNNVNFGANIGGHKWSEESKRRDSEARKGKGNPFYGRKHTPESIEKMKGKKDSDETRLKRIEGQRKGREREKLKKDNAIH